MIAGDIIVAVTAGASRAAKRPAFSTARRHRIPSSEEHRTDMPLWTIHHTPGTFTDEDKHRLASRIADHYEQVGLPRFYVVTLFHGTQVEDFCVRGGAHPGRGPHRHRPHRPAAPDRVSRRRTAQWIKGIMQPYLERHARLHWEFHADETSEDLWMINGIVPPTPGSDAEKAWAERNAASPYCADDGS